MLNVSATARIFVHTEATDMRKGFQGLSAIIRDQFQSDPTDGSLFIFVNRRRDRMKLLHFADGGFWLYYRLLEAGTFEPLRAADESHKLQKDYVQLFRSKFGHKSEPYIADPNQLRLDFGDTDDAADAADGLADAVEEADLIPAHKRRKPKKKSHAFPAHLPRVEHIVEVPEADQTCPEHGEKELLPEAMWDVRECGPIAV